MRVCTHFLLLRIDFALWAWNTLLMDCFTELTREVSGTTSEQGFSIQSKFYLCRMKPFGVFLMRSSSSVRPFP